VHTKSHRPATRLSSPWLTAYPSFSLSLSLSLSLNLPLPPLPPRSATPQAQAEKDKIRYAKDMENYTE
jgi:hypothetical protein